MLLKRKWNEISLLPYIQPHKLDLVNRWRKKKKKLCKEKSDSSLRPKYRDDINLKTPLCRTSLNIILDFWLITLPFKLEYNTVVCFSLQPLKFKFTTIYNYCIPYVILIHLLMQPCGFVWTKKKSTQNAFIFILFSLCVLTLIL